MLLVAPLFVPPAVIGAAAVLLVYFAGLYLRLAPSALSTVSGRYDRLYSSLSLYVKCMNV